ncbi:Protein phosphatase PTC7 fig [Grifola frondosa]|uniref:Protein phosphatase n=1 Tax=Grifola frondosa TaxID=5627 RepID=A0A1C7MHK0_GRIFR|nr:Protein phosphatase PTC7 fig [Grifola frondosa]
MRDQSGISLGVADGVGGWVDAGVDPLSFPKPSCTTHTAIPRRLGLVSQKLIPTQEYEEREQVEGWELSPSECLESAYGGVLRERGVVAGSSTACILTLNASSGVLRAANLGDSGFMIIRARSIIHQQRGQIHFFNCPKQLSKLPISAATRRFPRACVDSPQDADLFETTLRDGDIVIAYTDGLSDNVFPSELIRICSIISRRFQSYNSCPPPDQQNQQQSLLEKAIEDLEVQTMADRIVEYARMCMANRRRVSPFEVAAAREGQFFRGGVRLLISVSHYVVRLAFFRVTSQKIDDVTVVVALVRETQ